MDPLYLAVLSFMGVQIIGLVYFYGRQTSFNEELRGYMQETRGRIGEIESRLSALELKHNTIDLELRGILGTRKGDAA